VPLAAAIGAFGVIFGAAAGAYIDPVLVVAMSALVFSGTLQFAALGLLIAGAGAPAILLTAVALNMRHLVLGAVLRPRVEGSPLRRAVLAWFLLDESFGLAVAAKRNVGRVLLASGALFFVTWVGGTLLGLLGAQVALEGLAAAVFPVLFVGLAALTVRGRDGVLRSVVAAVIVVVLALLVPALYSFLPIIAAVIVAVPSGRRRA
jgi:predicted branched-subunit amino acid permease